MDRAMRASALFAAFFVSFSVLSAAPVVGTERSPAVADRSDAWEVDSVRVGRGEPAIRPPAGTTVVRESPQGRTVYVGVTATCTKSYTAGTPWLASGRARAQNIYELSTGCPASERYVGHLQREACGWLGCEWFFVDSKSGWISPGTWMSLALGKDCLNSDQDRWRSEARLSGGSIYSSTVWLSCGG